MNDDVIDDEMSNELPNYDQSNLTDFVYNEMNQAIDAESIQKDKPTKSIEEQKSDFLENVEYFNNNRNLFFSLDEGQQYVNLRDIRHSINVKSNPPFKFWHQNSIIDEFVNFLVGTHQCTNILFNIEILRLFNRISQVYSEFINPSNIESLNKLLNTRTSQEENPLVRHFALILIGKIARQSKKWAEYISSLFICAYSGIEYELKPDIGILNTDDYYNNRILEFEKIVKNAMKCDANLEYYKISSKKGDPYVYALRGFTKMLADTECLNGHFDKIIILVLKYFHESYVQHSGFDVYSGGELVEVLNDVIQANTIGGGILKTLQCSEFYVQRFFGSFIPDCVKMQMFYLLKPILKLISSFFNNGEQFADLIDDFNYDIITFLLLGEDPLKCSIAAADCMLSIIELKKEDGVALFFNEGPKYHHFITFIELTSDENAPYLRKIHFFKLAGLIFQYFIFNVIDFNLHKFINAALDSIDQEDYDLATCALYAIHNLYNRMQIIGNHHEFNAEFIQLDGKDTIERLINDEQGSLYDAANAFMSIFDGFNE